MKGLLRRLRGIVGTGLTWAIGFAGFSSLVLLFVGGSSEDILASIPITSLFGFTLGSGFAAILSLAEARKSLEDLSLPRVALWGALGGCLVTATCTLVFVGTVFWKVLLVFGALSAGFSSGSVALAKRADTRLIEGGDELPALEGE